MAKLKKISDGLDILVPLYYINDIGREGRNNGRKYLS